MKYVFMAAFVLLVLASAATHFAIQKNSGEVPVLYWVTDDNPARREQVRRFHAWLEKNHYPSFELRTDSANRDVSKTIIQGVSGMCGDILDVWSGTGDMVYFQQLGILADVTREGVDMGFDPSHTYPSIAPQITLHGRQYMFPCNVSCFAPWVNLATFRKYGQPRPPWRWSLEEFEARGKAFVAAANPPGQPRQVFFVDAVSVDQIARSLGVTLFNETLTAAAIDDPRYVRSLKLVKQWTYQDHLIPTAADLSSFSSDSGYFGGSFLQLFHQGSYAMVNCGRYALVQFRQFGPMELAVVEPPNGGFPTVSTATRAAAIYSGSKHKDLAINFLKFLASKDYNSQVVDDADALPPNPLYTRDEAFSHPARFPTEWECHDPWPKLQEIAIGPEFSDFVPSSTVWRLVALYQDRYMNDQCTAEQAVHDLAVEINAEIQRTLEENPVLRPRYQQMLALQREIEQLRQGGRTVAVEWIDNPFHREYYRFKGWSK